MAKIVIYGIERGYALLLNQINFERMKGNIDVVAVVQKGSLGKYCQYKDGFRVIEENEIEEINFDYIIVSDYENWKTESVHLNAVRKIDTRKIMNGQAWLRPLFDFRQYSELISNPVTILSDDCWGGFVYKYLCLQHSSPFINTYPDLDQFLKFISDPFYYLEKNLMIEEEGDFRYNIVPVGSLGEGDKKIYIRFVHCASFQEASEQWNRRVKRINKNNIFVKMGMKCNDPNFDEYIDKFEKIQYPKILFCSKPTDNKDCVYFPHFEYDERKSGRVIYYSFDDWMRYKYNYSINIFGLLTSHENYYREL